MSESVWYRGCEIFVRTSRVSNTSLCLLRRLGKVRTCYLTNLICVFSGSITHSYCEFGLYLNDKLKQNVLLTGPQLPRIDTASCARLPLGVAVQTCRDAPHCMTIKLRHLAFHEWTVPDFAEMPPQVMNAQWWEIRIAVRAFLASLFGHNRDIKSRTHAREVLGTISHSVGPALGSTRPCYNLLYLLLHTVQSTLHYSTV